MHARVESFVLHGIDAVVCEVEVDLTTTTLPKTTIVGLPDTAVRESMERVRAAIVRWAGEYPAMRITINLAPAHLRKEGPVYDLPIALALLRATGMLPRGPAPDADGVPGLDTSMVAGELALDGRVRPVRGAISLALLARERGVRSLILPAPNAGEAAAVPGLDVYGVESLGETVALLRGEHAITPAPAPDLARVLSGAAPVVDFADVRGQETVKRALTIAAAGAHNVLLVGPAGTGKTMMAKALAGVLPPLTLDEALEVTRVHSCAGVLPPGTTLIARRPVRAPHHTASASAVVGGGTVPRPGEVSLAHRGVLFLDEVPEFPRAVLETLRQPLEDGTVTIARAHGTVRFPARFMLVGALNPTAQGDMPADGGQRAMTRYLDRISGPLLDRMDLHVEVPAVSYGELAGRPGTGSADIRARVHAVRTLQRARGRGVASAEMTGAELDAVGGLDDGARGLLRAAMSELGLSARGYDRVRRVARTIADLETGEVEGAVQSHHVAEAIQYRWFDRVLA